MFKTYPRFAFRENRIILSEEELKLRVKEAVSLNKSCEISVYAFSKWKNSKLDISSVIIDLVMVKGKKEDLEKVGDYYLQEGVKSILYFDGKDYYLFLDIYLKSLDDLESFQVPFKKVKVIKNPLKKIVLPGKINFKTGKKSKVLKVWK